MLPNLMGNHLRSSLGSFLLADSYRNNKIGSSLRKKIIAPEIKDNFTRLLSKTALSFRKAQTIIIGEASGHKAIFPNHIKCTYTHTAEEEKQRSARLLASSCAEKERTTRHFPLRHFSSRRSWPNLGGSYFILVQI
jgi:hypothetical protein